MAAMRNLAIGVLAEQDRSMPPRSGSTAATHADPWRPSESGSDQTDITQERQSPGPGVDHCHGASPEPTAAYDLSPGEAR